MNIFRSVWHYYKAMQSESDGLVSIKRNAAWRGVLLLMFVVAYSLIELRNRLPLSEYVGLCKFYAILIAAFILLVLGITSIEKLTMFVQSIKGTARLQAGNATENTNDKANETAPQ